MTEKKFKKWNKDWMDDNGQNMYKLYTIKLWDDEVEAIEKGIGLVLDVLNDLEVNGIVKLNDNETYTFLKSFLSNVKQQVEEQNKDISIWI